MKIIWTGRNSDARSEEFDSIEAADAFASSGESEDYSEIGVFGYNPDDPCCSEGPCSHEVNRAYIRAGLWPYSCNLQDIAHPPVGTAEAVWTE